jgi:predicted transcriptional regulator
VDAAVAIKFRRADLDAGAGKFVRGLHYQRTGKMLPASTKVTSFEPPEEVMKQAAQLPGGDLSDGLLYRYVAEQDGRAFWFFLLWGQVKIGVLVEPPGTVTTFTE